ncbi:MAG: Spy/CpxP family protein refolding chaperone [Rhodospirillales bacterium]
MKAFLKMTALSMVVGGLLFAQAPAGQRMANSRPQPRMARQAGMRVPGGLLGQLMSGYLGLTEEQKTQIKAIHQNARTEAQPLQQQLRQNRKDLHAAIVAGQPVESLAAAQGDLLGKLTAIRANTQIQVRKVLTPEQLAKLDQLRSSRRPLAGRKAAAPPKQ